MKTHSTIAGNAYTVTSPNGGTVTDAAGKLNKVVGAGDQLTVMAPSEALYCSDDDSDIRKANFKNARLALGMLGAGDNLLPSGYTRLEYLESTGTQYIDTGCTANQDTTIKTRWQFIEVPGYAGVIFSHLGEPPRFGAIYRDNLNRSRFDYGTRMNYASGIIYNIGQVYDIEKRGRYNYVDGVLVCTNQETEPFESSRIGISAASSSLSSKFKLYSFVMENDGVMKLNLIPALDHTGAPCLFDTVSRKTFYNAGTGDFVTPQSGASTYSLRGRRVLPDWGKLTPTGLRRLYHAPANYKGELYDYALENGYKPIVEEPAPEVGYWVPVWHETEEEIVLEWVETEPPAEEKLSTDK